MSKRKGECKMCGQCCEGCYLLSEPDKEGRRSCKVYNNRPTWCGKDMPLDKWDLYYWKLRGIKNCGYYWDDYKI